MNTLLYSAEAALPSAESASQSAKETSPPSLLSLRSLSTLRALLIPIPLLIIFKMYLVDSIGPGLKICKREDPNALKNGIRFTKVQIQLEHIIHTV